MSMLVNDNIRQQPALSADSQLLLGTMGPALRAEFRHRVVGMLQPEVPRAANLPKLPLCRRIWKALSFLCGSAYKRSAAIQDVGYHIANILRWADDQRHHQITPEGKNEFLRYLATTYSDARPALSRGVKLSDLLAAGLHRQLNGLPDGKRLNTFVGLRNLLLAKPHTENSDGLRMLNQLYQEMLPFVKPQFDDSRAPLVSGTNQLFTMATANQSRTEIASRFAAIRNAGIAEGNSCFKIVEALREQLFASRDQRVGPQDTMETLFRDQLCQSLDGKTAEDLLASVLGQFKKDYRQWWSAEAAKIAKQWPGTQFATDEEHATYGPWRLVVQKAAIPEPPDDPSAQRTADERMFRYNQEGMFRRDQIAWMKNRLGELVMNALEWCEPAVAKDALSAMATSDAPPPACVLTANLRQLLSKLPRSELERLSREVTEDSTTLYADRGHALQNAFVAACITAACSDRSNQLTQAMLSFGRGVVCKGRPRRLWADRCHRHDCRDDSSDREPAR